MDESARQLQTLLDLDARHDDLLSQLDELDKRVVQVLSQYLVSRTPQAGGESIALENPDPSSP